MTRDFEKEPGAPPIIGETIEDDGVAYDMDDRETGRSDFVAFLLGGVVVAGGLFAFLYYDGGNPLGERDTLTTGSIKPITTPVTPAPSITLPRSGAASQPDQGR